MRSFHLKRSGLRLATTLLTLAALTSSCGKDAAHPGGDGDGDGDESSGGLIAGDGDGDGDGDATGGALGDGDGDTGGIPEGTGGDGPALGGMGGASVSTGGSESGMGGDGTGGEAACTHDLGCWLSTPGEPFCFENATVECEDLDDDGCLEMIVGSVCASGTYCSEGGAAPTCKAGDTCETAIVVPAQGMTISGDNFSEDFSDNYEFDGADCRLRGPDLPDAIFQIDLKAGESFLLTDYNETGLIDAVTGLTSTCGASAACIESDDDPDGIGPYTATSDETVFVWLTVYEDWSGEYPYEMTFERWRCGDGVIGGVEECDDGNGIAGDGCTACETDVGAYCVTGSVPSDCTLAPSIGTFGPGDTIPLTSHLSQVPAGEAFYYAITFTEPVWLSGNLMRTTIGDPDLTLLNAEGDSEFGAQEVGDEEWSEEFLVAGTYYFEVLAYGDIPLAPGFNLTLSTISPTNLGILSHGGIAQSSGALPLTATSDYYKIELTQTTLLSGSVTGSSGDPDFFVTDSTGTRVIQRASGGSIEDVGTHELDAGTYYIEVRAYAALPSYELVLTGAAP